MNKLFKEGRTKGYSPERFEMLKKENAYFIFLAGKEWNGFPYQEGYQLLKEKDYNGDYLIKAGKEWKEFPYQEAANYLIQKDIGFLSKMIIANWPLNFNSYWEYDDGRNVLMLYKMKRLTKEEALQHPKLTEKFRIKIC